MFFRTRLLLVAVALFGISIFAGPAAAAPITVSVMPASPRYMEPVYVRITPDFATGLNIYGAQVSMNGTAISVRYQSLIEVGPYYYDVMLGRFPQGTYTVTVAGPAGPVETGFTVAAPAMSSAYPGTVPAVNFTDLWWNPSEPGWGMSITQGPTNEVFAAWFVYDAAGNPTWYTLQPGRWTATNVYSVYTGPVYRTTGPYFGGAFDPARVSEVQAGTATLSFRDSSHGELRYTIDGVTGVKPLERMPVE